MHFPETGIKKEVEVSGVWIVSDESSWRNFDEKDSKDCLVVVACNQDNGENNNNLESSDTLFVDDIFSNSTSIWNASEEITSLEGKLGTNVKLNIPLLRKNGGQNASNHRQRKHANRKHGNSSEDVEDLDQTNVKFDVPLIFTESAKPAPPPSTSVTSSSQTMPKFPNLLLGKSQDLGIHEKMLIGPSEGGKTPSRSRKHFYILEADPQPQRNAKKSDDFVEITFTPSNSKNQHESLRHLCSESMKMDSVDVSNDAFASTVEDIRCFTKSNSEQEPGAHLSSETRLSSWTKSPPIAKSPVVKQYFVDSTAEDSVVIFSANVRADVKDFVPICQQGVNDVDDQFTMTTTTEQLITDEMSGVNYTWAESNDKTTNAKTSDSSPSAVPQFDIYDDMTFKKHLKLSKKAKDVDFVYFPDFVYHAPNGMIGINAHLQIPHIENFEDLPKDSSNIEVCAIKEDLDNKDDEMTLDEVIRSENFSLDYSTEFFTDETNNSSSMDDRDDLKDHVSFDFANANSGDDQSNDVFVLNTSYERIHNNVQMDNYEANASPSLDLTLKGSLGHLMKFQSIDTHSPRGSDLIKSKSDVSLEKNEIIYHICLERKKAMVLMKLIRKRIGKLADKCSEKEIVKFELAFVKEVKRTMEAMEGSVGQWQVVIGRKFVALLEYDFGQSIFLKKKSFYILIVRKKQS